MLTHLADDLPELSRLALASARSADRDRFTVLLALDQRIARIIMRDGDPTLKQVKLAWWRESLRDEVRQGRGEPLVEAARTLFAGYTAGLVAMVDGWEGLLTSDSLDDAVVFEFAVGKADAFKSLASAIGQNGALSSVEASAMWWTLADYSARCQNSDDRVAVGRLARQLDPLPSLPRALRPLAILAGMGHRSITRGGAPLLGDRLSPFVAARIALLGR